MNREDDNNGNGRRGLKPITRPQLVVPQELLDATESSDDFELIELPTLPDNGDISASGILRLKGPMGIERKAARIPNEEQIPTLDIEIPDDFFEDAEANSRSLDPPTPLSSALISPQRAALNTLASDPDFWAVARADSAGRVTDLTGQMDAETVCAIASMATNHLSAALGALALGDLVAWCVVEEDKTWYARVTSDGLAVGLGGPKRNPTTALEKFSASNGESL